ncbi:MarR family winged helix-turn-helix transcriptional regulator [Paenibacillus thailandensis]|uniref:MarR family winged helix-turn-helix transcriptional regulator n=1 Tax=Paenibacillus thailandensis TaxID=393250 RepID=A0ABW5QYE8_9BACL
MDERHWLMLEELDWDFRRMVRKFVKERDKVNIEGVSLPGLLILRKLELEGEQKLGDLGEQLDFTSGAVTGICDKLEEKGFALRKRKPEDRRTVLLDITEAGKAFLARHAKVGERCITLLFEGFAPEELAAQIGYYKRIAANLERFSATILQLAQDAEQEAGLSDRSSGQERAERGEARRPYISY